jgi:hypothetical protein
VKENLKKGMRISAGLLLFLLIVCFATVGSSKIGNVQADTGISGIISTDQTWSNANGAYNLAGDTLIEEGVTITIQPDTTVNFNGFYIRVNGTLIIGPGAILNMGASGERLGSIQVYGTLTARGTTTKPIEVNGGICDWGFTLSLSQIDFRASSAGWNEQTSQGCIIENAVLNNLNVPIRSSIKFSNNQLNGQSLSVSGGQPVISGNLFASGTSIYVGEQGSPTITNNQIVAGGIYLDGYGATVSMNVISNPQGHYTSDSGYAGTSGIGISVNMESGAGQVLIEKNLLKNCKTGIELPEVNNVGSSKLVVIRYNSIMNGVTIEGKVSPIITNNNLDGIYLNPDFASQDVNATNNWWNTTNTTIIDSLINDYYDNFNLGKVSYTPILTTPEPLVPDENMIIIDVPSTPTATLTPTATPTVPSTTQPAQNPMPSENINQTSASIEVIWEASAVALFFVIVISVLVAVKFRRKKGRIDEIR